MSYYYYGHNPDLKKKYSELSLVIKDALEKANPRREVTQRLQVYASPLDDFISKAKDFASVWKKKLEDVCVEHDTSEENGFTRSELFLEIAGLETDEQYHARLWQTHEANMYREERDLEDFKRLSVKFSK